MIESKKSINRAIAITLYMLAVGTGLGLTGWGLWIASDPLQARSKETACKELYLGAANQLTIGNMRANIQSFVDKCPTYQQSTEIKQSLLGINEIISDKSGRELVPIAVRDAALKAERDWSDKLDDERKFSMIPVLFGVYIYICAHTLFKIWLDRDF